jgi:hypothetical protein
MTYPDGSYYEGEFGNGMRAKGRYMSNDGTLEYVGAWWNDLQHGQGVLNQKNHLKYTGASQPTHFIIIALYLSQKCIIC